VLRNRASDRRAAKLRRQFQEQRAAKHDEVESTAEVAARFEIYSDLVHRVRALDPDYRDVVIYRYLEDLSPRQIAARLDLPIETIKKRLQRVGEVRDQGTSSKLPTTSHSGAPRIASRRDPLGHALSPRTLEITAAIQGGTKRYSKRQIVGIDARNILLDLRMPHTRADKQHECSAEVKAPLPDLVEIQSANESPTPKEITEQAGCPDEDAQ